MYNIHYFSHWSHVAPSLSVLTFIYEGWNFNFGNTPLDWIQELLE